VATAPISDERSLARRRHGERQKDHIMSLKEKLDAMRADKEEGRIFPPDVVAQMHKSTAELIASGQAERALKAGDLAPMLVLPDANGALISSQELLAKGPLVLTFYRGVWCPYCNLDLQAIEEVAPRIRALGAALAAVSQQTAPNSRKSQADNNLSFPILNDKGGETAAAFGIRFRLPDDLIDLYKRLRVDLAIINGEPSWTLPMPARYVIGQDGVIAYAEVNPDYTRRPEPDELLPVLERLRSHSAS
jgi:peroxiredoxin